MLPLVVVIALALALLMVKGRVPVQHAGTSLPERIVEVIEVVPIDFRSSVTPYGRVEPAIVLQAKAEVAGKLSYLHPNLKRGAGVAAGTVVVRIDTSDYEVSLRQTEAELADNRQSLLQLEEEEKSAQRSLGLARQNLEYGRKELARIKEIFERQLVSRSTYEAEQQKVLQYQQQVEELQGQINSFASRRNSVKARIMRAEEQVKGQQTALGRTEIRMPFDARIGQVLVEQNEFVAVGNTLFEALDVNGVEINAQLPARHMSELLVHLDEARRGELALMPIGDALRSLGLSAMVRLVGGNSHAVWEATVLRLSEAMDPTRRTLGLVVGIDNSLGKVIPGMRPPLMKGMYTAVQLSTPAMPALVVPRRAVHEGRAYLVDEQQRLAIRGVDVRFRQGELVVLNGGLREGDRLIVSDLYPVIEGMPLRVVPATAVADELRTMARGELQP